MNSKLIISKGKKAQYTRESPSDTHFTQQSYFLQASLQQTLKLQTTHVLP